ncbi:MAG: ABC transporter permease, partial [Propionibacteriaceae bacterium]|nr:ABC transporter permease [Propionibacteriaceae bacterium]
MFRTALRELRHHPGRYLAILIAIAISVGFMTAASVVTATESQAMAKVAGAPYTKADMVVTVNNVTTDCQTMDCQDERTAGSQLADMVRQASPLVTLAWPEATTYLLVTNNDASTYVNTYAAPPVALSWATVGSPPQPVGATPLGPDDIVIDSKTASALGARVGSTVDVDSSGGTTTTLHLTVVGITNDLSNLYAMSTAFIAADTFDAV